MSATADPNDDAVCFSRFLAGDDTALAELFDRHNHRLFVYALKLMGSTELAEDITQELWERVIRLRLNPSEVRNPVGFLFRIARNLCLNQIKARRPLIPLAMLPESAHPVDAAAERSEMEEVVTRALEDLSFEHREVLVMNIYCGYRLDEIAQMLGKAPHVIWMRASRARGKMRKRVIELLGSNHPELRRYRLDERNQRTERA